MKFETSAPERSLGQMPVPGGRAMAMVLAGGEGRRLRPLTDHRSKAALPFGGNWRLIDFVLSNLVNSGVREIFVLTQFEEASVLRHLEQSWSVVPSLNDCLLIPLPSRRNGSDHRYLGTADAITKNLGLIRRRQPDFVLVFASDHVYTMNVSQMISFHLNKDADVTVATLPLPVEQCSQFGTARVDREWRMARFEEKVAHPAPLPGSPDRALVSMGNYIFKTKVLLEELEQDSRDKDSRHDFGRDLLPKLCLNRRVYAYDFRRNVIAGSERPADYWRDVGTIDSYYQAHMDLNNPLCHLNLQNQSWPLWSARYHDLPARVAVDPSGKRGVVENSLLGSSTVISGSSVRNSVIGPQVLVSSGAIIEESVILGQVVVGERARIRRAIIDQGVVVPEGETIGYDAEYDAARYHLEDSGVAVITRDGLAPSTLRREPWTKDALFAGMRA